jgi:CheY-like chemotaxis protein
MGRPIEILLVEDSPSDADLTREALREGRVINNLRVVSDGEQALAFLRRQPPFARVPRPDLILLDLNLPKRDGREVLEVIKSDDELKCIPVVVLTTSREESDVMAAYGRNANCYVTKPVDLDQFIDAIRSIDHFWLNIVTLPSK